MDQNLVTSGSCQSIIRKCVGNDHFEVLTYKVKPFEDKEREYYKANSILEISVKISRQISRFRFFLKSFVCKRRSFRDYLESVDYSQKEILFYEQIYAQKEDFLPQYLYGEKNKVLVLEDVSLKSFRVARKSNPHMLDRFHISLAIKAIAKLHAGFLLHPEMESLIDHYQEPLWNEDEGSFGNRMIASSVKGLKALMKLQDKSQDFDEEIDSLVLKTFSIMKDKTKFKMVLCHGDLHSKNMLFKYENNSPTECKLLNFGFFKHFLPAYDLLTLIFNSSTQLFRQHYFTYLIEEYYESLRSELKSDIDFFSWSDFRRSINYLLPAIKLQKVFHLQNFGAKPGFYRILLKNEEEFEQYLLNDKSRFMIELHKRDPIFREMMNEALEELAECLKMPKLFRENCYDILESELASTVYELKGFEVVDMEEKCQLTLKVAVDLQKVEEVKELKYLVSCADNDISVLEKVL